MTAEREGLADLLAAHDYRWSSGGSICLCGFVPTVDASTLWTQQDYYRHHLADLLAARDRRVRAEAVREAADAWTQGAWSDVMLPKPTPPAVPVIAYTNRVGDWLRNRANEIEAEG